MSSMVEGVLLPAGEGAEPFPIPVHDHTDIQGFVGGVFDVVVTKYNHPDNPDEYATVVGYVHDEGLLLGLPLNKLASVVFQREIRGDVVLVGGADQNGVYDGANHELPTWFTTAVFTTLVGAVDNYNDEAENHKQAFQRAVREGLMTSEQVNELVHRLYVSVTNGEPEQLLAMVTQTLVEYHLLRTVGALSRPTPEIRDALRESLTVSLAGDAERAYEVLVELADKLEAELNLEDGDDE